MPKRNQKNAAVYLRLSRSDGDDIESNSIGNQRAIIQKYAIESGLNIVGEYVEMIISSLIQCPAKKLAGHCL